MLNTAGAAKSRLVPYRFQVQVYSPGGGTDPTDCVYKVRLWPSGGRCGSGHDDYGWHWSPGRDGLQAATDSDPAKLVAMETSDGLVLTGQFPVTDLRCLGPGSYAGSIVAALPNDPDSAIELVTFAEVFR